MHLLYMWSRWTQHKMFLFLNSDTVPSGSTPDDFANIWPVKFHLTRLSLKRSSRNFATMAMWWNDFSCVTKSNNIVPLLSLSAIVKQATKSFPLLPSIIAIRSVSDKLAVVHSFCLFGAESYSGQRERVSGKVSNQRFVYPCLANSPSVHSYTHLTTSSMLNKCLLVHNFQNNCSTEWHWLHVIQKSIEVWLHNKCHKIYLSGPFGIFCLYIILTISYLRVQTMETSSLPTDSLRPLFKQMKIFSGILTVYFNCKYLLIYAQVTRVPPWDFTFWAKSCRGNDEIWYYYVYTEKPLWGGNNKVYMHVSVRMCLPFSLDFMTVYVFFTEI